MIDFTCSWAIPPLTIQELVGKMFNDTKTQEEVCSLIKNYLDTETLEKSKTKTVIVKRSRKMKQISKTSAIKTGYCFDKDLAI